MPLSGEVGPRLTMSPEPIGLPPYQVEVGLGQWLLDPASHLATIHQRHRQTDRTGEDMTGKGKGQRRVQLRRRLSAPGRRGVHRLSPASGRLPAPAGASRRLR